MSKSIRIHLFLLLPLLLMLSGAPVLGTESPGQLVQDGVEEVLALVKDKSLDQATRRQKMRDSISERFDFRTMSQSILARNWRKATPQQQDRFIALIKRLLENTYIAAIESYTSEIVTYDKPRVRGKKATVPVNIVLKSGSEAPLEFRLRNKDGRWGVYDVVIEGISLVSNYRSSFQNVVRKDGIDGLLAQMEEKVRTPAPKPQRQG